MRVYRKKYLLPTASFRSFSTCGFHLILRIFKMDFSKKRKEKIATPLCPKVIHYRHLYDESSDFAFPHSQLRPQLRILTGISSLRILPFGKTFHTLHYSFIPSPIISRFFHTVNGLCKKYLYFSFFAAIPTGMCYFRPVDPNPPVPRSVSLSSSAALNSALR